MRQRNGLSNSPRLTQSSYRQAVSETVRALQGSDTDKDFADAWGTSKGTVLNARNRNHDLCGMALLMLGQKFGSEGLATVLHLIGMKAVSVDSLTLDVSDIPCDVAKCVPLLIQLLGDGHASDMDIHQLDEAGVIESLGKTADMLRTTRDRLRLRVVA